jgi:hypothetical protein
MIIILNDDHNKKATIIAQAILTVLDLSPFQKAPLAANFLYKLFYVVVGFHSSLMTRNIYPTF